MFAYARRVGGCVPSHDRPALGAVSFPETLPMIAFARPYHEEEPETPAWHDGFLKLLPAIRDQLRFALRKLPADARAEATCECIAHVTLAYQKLHQQGKLDVAYATSLATYAVKHFFAGRRVGTPLNTNDVSSPWAQKQRGFRVKSLDRRAPNGERKEVVVEDGRDTPAEVATARLDIEAWLDELPAFKRSVAERLGAGESTAATASQFAVTPGRISQLRKELAESWDAFQAQAMAFA